MNMLWKSLLVALPAAVIGFMLQSNGPIGSVIWPMHDGTPEPAGADLALLMLYGVFEALAFGIGVAFLVFGLPWVKQVVGSTGAAWAVFLSVAWTLVNWVPHTALHMTHGNLMQPSDFGGLVAIEYGFHLTMIVAGMILVLFFARAIGQARAAATGAASPQ